MAIREYKTPEEREREWERRLYETAADRDRWHEQSNLLSMRIEGLVPRAQYDEVATGKEAAEQTASEALDRAIKAENNAWEVAQDTHLGTIEGMEERIAELQSQVTEAKRALGVEKAARETISEALHSLRDRVGWDKAQLVADLDAALFEKSMRPTVAEWNVLLGERDEARRQLSEVVAVYRKKVDTATYLRALLDKAIVIWERDEMPPEYRQLCDPSVETTWVAFVPLGIAQPLWMMEGTAFGSDSVTEHEVDDGTVYIGAHE